MNFIASVESLAHQLIWWFPGIGLPPVIIHFHGVSTVINHPAIGDPPFMEPPYGDPEAG